MSLHTFYLPDDEGVGWRAADHSTTHMRAVKHADHIAEVVPGPRRKLDKLAAEDRQAFEGVGANGLAHWLFEKQDIFISLLAW